MGFGIWIRGDKIADFVPKSDYKSRLQYFANKIYLNDTSSIHSFVNGDYTSEDIDRVCSWLSTPFERILQEAYSDPDDNPIPKLFVDMLTLNEGNPSIGGDFEEWEEEWYAFLDEFEVDIWNPPPL